MEAKYAHSRLIHCSFRNEEGLSSRFLLRKYSENILIPTNGGHDLEGQVMVMVRSPGRS